MDNVHAKSNAKYFQILEQWALRIKTAQICCNSELITEVLEEINLFYWLSEGEELDTKVANFKLKY